MQPLGNFEALPWQFLKNMGGKILGYNTHDEWNAYDLCFQRQSGINFVNKKGTHFIRFNFETEIVQQVALRRYIKGKY